MVSFDLLWTNYPSSDPCIDPTTGEPPKGFQNQCALRLSHALARSGVNFKSFRGGGCPTGSESGFAASAQKLADWLLKRPLPGCPSAERHTGKSLFPKIEDRTGIVFLGDYWVRSPGGPRSGDHIDLWNGYRFTAWHSVIRTVFGISIEGTMTDYKLAKSALFWPLP